MVHPGVESEGAVLVNRWDFYETLTYNSIIPDFWNRVSSLIYVSLDGATQVHTKCDAVIPHADIFGVRLFFFRKSLRCELINESRAFHRENNYISSTNGFMSGLSFFVA